MAAAIQRLHDNFLSCIICTNLYTDPCTLACGHTFCRTCLAAFTKTRQDAIKAKSIPCPNCRQMTNVPNPGTPVEDWVKQIKPSFLIQGLLDDFTSQDSADTATVANLCYLCFQHDERAPGTSHCLDCDIIICNRCVKSHLAIPATSGHVISKLGEQGKARKVRKVFCNTHKSIVEFFCKDYCKAACQKCCILDHRKCDNVVTIESMVPEMKAVLTQNMDKISKQIRQTTLGLENKQGRIKEMETKLLQGRTEIRNVSQEAVNLIHQKEKQLLKELGDETEKQTDVLKSQVKSEEIDMQMYQQHYKFIKQVLKSETEMDMYDMYRACQSGAVVMGTTKYLYPIISNEVAFEKGFDKQLLQKHFKFGTIKVIKTEIDPECTPVLVKGFDINRNDDRYIPDPVDVIVLDVDGRETLVVTDFKNKCIKSIWVSSMLSRHVSLKVENNPWSVAKLDHSRVAVSFEFHKEILIVKVTPYLVLVNKILTQKMYSGLTALDDSTLVGGCHDPPSLDIIGMTGCVMKSLTSMNILQGPNFLSTTSNGNILVSDASSKSVICVTPEGTLVFKYSPTGHNAFGRPQGITTSPWGDIFVSDWVANKVVQLTATGEFVRDILTKCNGINRPIGICLHNGIMYLVQHQEPVKVFRVNRSN